MERQVLKVKKREQVGKGINDLRKNGLVPAVVYGKRKDNENLTVDRLLFDHVYKEVGSSAIIKLDIEGNGEKNVLIHDVVLDPVTNLPQHIDFYEVSMTEKITATIPLHFMGDSPAVIDLQGTLLTNKDEVEVECLPTDLPQNIEVDVSILTDFEKAIHVSDLSVPSGVEVKDDPEELVVTVEPPRSEEEMAELEEPVEAPEMPEAEKGAEEEAAEGEEGAEEKTSPAEGEAPAETPAGEKKE